MRSMARRGKGGRLFMGSDQIDFGEADVPIRVNRSRVLRTVATTLRALGCPRPRVSLTLVDDRTIKRLNLRYRGKNRTTDVLAFPMEDHVGLPIPILGEVVVSVETAKRQAREHGHSLHEELDLLIVHGLLHLVGYDDEDPLEARLMHDREMAILGRIYRRPAPSLRVGPVRLNQECHDPSVTSDV